MSNTHPHIGEPTCPTPARQRPGESLAAPARTGQGEGTDNSSSAVRWVLPFFLLGDRGLPFGGWGVRCEPCGGALCVPSVAVLEARSA